MVLKRKKKEAIQKQSKIKQNKINKQTNSLKTNPTTSATLPAKATAAATITTFATII